jgi:hypothetical protein
MNDSTKGVLIASLVAGLVGCSSSSAPTEPATPSGATAAGAGVMCTGINECANKGACKGADHACGGKNSCAKKGLTKVDSAEDCTKKGGTVQAM